MTQMTTYQRLATAIDKPRFWHYMLLIVACLLPICVLRDFTPANELRYISIADEALRNGHWFSLTNNGEPYSDKPPFYFWLIMITKLVTGDYHMGLLVAFSMIPALGTAVTLDRWCREELGEKYRNMAPLMLITTGYYAGTAVVLRMDMLMVWCIVLALRAFYRMYRGEGSFARNQILFAIYILLGFYAKAFMGVLIPLVTSAVFLISRREGRTFFRYWNWKVWGIIVAGLIFWFGMVYAEAGGDYLYSLTVGQTVSRSVKVSVHKHPFYYYFVFLTYSIAPWTLLYVGALVHGIRKKMFRTDMQRLFVIEIISTFVMLSCFGSKLEIYLVPIFPFMTYLSLIVMEQTQWNRWLAFAVSFPAILTVLALPAYIVAAQILPDISHPLFYAASAILTAGGTLSLLLAWKHRDARRSAAVFCCGFLLAAFATGLALPKYNPQIGYGALCREAQAQEKEWQAQGVVTLGVWRAQNMSVYFPDRLQTLKTSEASTAETMSGKLLIVDSKALKDEGVKLLLEGKEQKPVLDGRYIFVRLP